MQFLAIVALCIFMAIAYGIIHDQVTARVCVEYFTVGHPPIFRTEDPTLLGLGWGIVATWWVGLLLGIPLAVAARAGWRPKRNTRSLFRPLAIVFVTTGFCALAAGMIGWCLASTGLISLGGSLASRLPPDRQVAFLADLWAHVTSYFVGSGGGFVIIFQVWFSRRKLATPNL